MAEKMTTIDLVKALDDATYDVEAYPHGFRWCVSVTAWPEHAEDLKDRGGELVPMDADQAERLCLAIWPAQLWPMDGAALLRGHYRPDEKEIGPVSRGPRWDDVDD